MIISKLKEMLRPAAAAQNSNRRERANRRLTVSRAIETQVPGIMKSLPTTGLAAKAAIATDEELLEMLLDGAVTAAAGRDLPKALLRRFRTLGAAVTAPEQDLLAMYGVNERVVSRLRAVQETMLRMLDRPAHYRIAMSSWERFQDWLTIRLGHEPRSIFMVVFLKDDLSLLCDEEIVAHALEGVSAYPGIIIRRALELGARHMVLVRNEPAGFSAKLVKQEAFELDLWVARHTALAALPLGMGVVDCVIVSPTGYVSCREEGLLSWDTASDDRD